MKWVYRVLVWGGSLLLVGSCMFSVIQQDTFERKEREVQRQIDVRKYIVEMYELEQREKAMNNHKQIP